MRSSPIPQRPTGRARRRFTWLASLASTTLCLAFGGVAAAGPANAIPPGCEPALSASSPAPDAGGCTPPPTDPGGGSTSGPAYFSLERSHGLGCLDDPSNTTDVAAVYQTHSCNHSAAQKFYLEPAGEPGLWVIKHGDQCLYPQWNTPPSYYVHQLDCN